MRGIEIWWLGQSGFRLRRGDGVEVYLDPFLSGKEDRVWETVGPAELARARLVLCTHEHIDHFDKPRRLAAAPGQRRPLLVFPACCPLRRREKSMDAMDQMDEMDRRP